jgi:hypothetical protein
VLEFLQPCWYSDVGLLRSAQNITEMAASRTVSILPCAKMPHAWPRRTRFAEHLAGTRRCFVRAVPTVGATHAAEGTGSPGLKSRHGPLILCRLRRALVGFELPGSRRLLPAAFAETSIRSVRPSKTSIVRGISQSRTSDSH